MPFLALKYMNIKKNLKSKDLFEKKKKKEVGQFFNILVLFSNEPDQTYAIFYL